MVNIRRSRSWASGAGLTSMPTSLSSGSSRAGFRLLFFPAVSSMSLGLSGVSPGRWPLVASVRPGRVT